MRSPLLMIAASAALFLSAPAMAQSHTGGIATGAKVAQGETVAQRISSLHDELQITPAEEDKWTAVAKAMTENAAAMEKKVSDVQSKSPNGMTAKDDLKTYEMFAQAHVDGLKNLRSAFDSLYDAMPADQQKIADGVFAKSHQKARRQATIII